MIDNDLSLLPKSVDGIHRNEGYGCQTADLKQWAFVSTLPQGCEDCINCMFCTVIEIKIR